MKTELWKKRQARSSFRPDPQQLSATCQMFRHDANVRENKSVAGSRSLLGRHAAPRGSAPREEGMELRGRHGCFLPPAIVPPGSPSLTLATCYFCSKVLSGVNTSPLALGTFLCTSPCQGRGPAPAAGAQPRVRASTRAPAQPSRRSDLGRADLGRAGLGRAGLGRLLQSSHAETRQSQVLAGRAHGAPAQRTFRPLCSAGANSDIKALCRGSTDLTPVLLFFFLTLCCACAGTWDQQCPWGPWTPPAGPASTHRTPQNPYRQPRLPAQLLPCSISSQLGCGASVAMAALEPAEPTEPHHPPQAAAVLWLLTGA